MNSKGHYGQSKSPYGAAPKNPFGDPHAKSKGSSPHGAKKSQYGYPSSGLGGSSLLGKGYGAAASANPFAGSQIGSYGGTGWASKLSGGDSSLIGSFSKPAFGGSSIING